MKRMIGAAIANWFRRKRGRAMGFATMGLSFGGILVMPLALFITLYGWRSALLVAGITTIGLGLPLASLVRHRPEQHGYLPDGDPPKEAPTLANPITETNAESPPAKQSSDEGERHLAGKPYVLGSWE